MPKGITKVFRCSSNTGLVAPRIFQDDTPEDKRAVQAPVTGVMMHPLAEFDGKMKTTDWTKLPVLPAAPEGEEETKWVIPDKFADQLSMVLADAPPLPGEEASYAQVRAVLEALESDAKLKAAFTAGARESNESTE